MFSITYAIRVASDKVIEHHLKKKYRTLEEAKEIANKNRLAIAYRIFDDSGYRVFSKRVER